MPNEIEGVAPNSLEAQALAELQKEGNDIETGKPDPNDGEVRDSLIPPKDEPKDEPKDDAPKGDEPKDEPKIERTPTMVEAWKLKVAEDQKAGLEKDLQEVNAKLEEMSKQKTPITDSQKIEIQDDIKAIAEEAGVDPEFLTKFANTILKKAQPSADLEKTIAGLQEERELIKQDNFYSKEFESDVLPLVKEYNLSDEALLQLKNTLKDFAFSETYAKVPLKEIFKLKEQSLELKTPKKSAEGKGIKVRNEVVDLDNLDEEKFKNLTPEQTEEFMKRKGGSGWK